ncbi:transglutaminase family protein [soil metagenome]
MLRTVSVLMEVHVTRPALLALQITPATPTASEHLTLTTDGRPVPVRELAAPTGGRIHVIDAPLGDLAISYKAEIDGWLPIAPSDETERLLYLRPSRYCPVDRFTGLAGTEFGGLTNPGDLADAVTAWVARRLSYVSGSSGPSDDAVDTLLQSEGVCRDYAHLVIALLRTRDVPARLAAVYAPGLDPMDFHAVAEAWVDGAWRVLDATGLAPRASMLRIATGRDAADTAFMSVHHGNAELRSVSVLTLVDDLPNEDPRQTIVLS